MADERTTIIKEGGSGGVIFIAVLLMALIMVAGYFLLANQQSENAKNDAIAGAAQSVSQTADKIGSAVDQQTK
jgi:uncharacterized protein HemX